MEKVYVVQEEWMNEGQYEDREDIWEIIAVVKDEQQALEMCHQLRKDKLAGLLSSEPNYKYDLVDKDGYGNSMCAINVDATWRFESGTYFWWYAPYDLIGS